MLERFGCSAEIARDLSPPAAELASDAPVWGGPRSILAAGCCAIDRALPHGMMRPHCETILLTSSRETEKGLVMASEYLPSSGRSERAEGSRPASTETAHSGAAGNDGLGSRGAPHEAIVLDDVAIQRSLTRIAHEIVERHEDLSRLYLVAIPNGGVPLGRILQRGLVSISGVEPPLGILDTTLYRDDLTRNGVRPPLRTTEMPSSVDERIVLIVEDVVNTGRTIRAAMDAMIDFGRPTGVQVVALVDRGHRELPIKIDYVGKNIPTQVADKVKFRSKGGGDLEPPFEVVVMGESRGEDR